MWSYSVRMQGKCGISKPKQLYRVLVYIHQYPLLKDVIDSRTLDCSASHVTHKIIGHMKDLAKFLDEVYMSSVVEFSLDWRESRQILIDVVSGPLALPFGPHESRTTLPDTLHGNGEKRWRFSCCVEVNIFMRNLVEAHAFLSLWQADTFPVKTEEPTDLEVGQVLFSVKDGSPVWKYLLVVSFLGHIICFAGPFPGTMSDKEIWEATAALHPLVPGEWIIADGVFKSIPQMFTPHPMPEDDETGRLIRWNNILAHYRARVEHINRVVKYHRMFQSFRSDVSVLEAAMKITVHLSNIELQRFPRYWPYGPWSHFD
eukprot:TRINITY_DN31_c0_g1_i10.p1 TRINITY_DN31_c0_g1~~TRINITY_DN31_c0_g1_i10.p1  ORF type:complete len:315 (+),score=6.55 TRINITY_DN31_c0_g1_i10:577-1521(+)